MFDMVIFDWDGTLADTQEVIVLAFQKVLRKVGCEVSDEFLERRIGIGAKNMFREALEIAKIRYDEEMINRLLEEKTKIHLMLTPKIKLFDGVTDLLEALRPLVKLALATMSNREVIEKTLREKGIKSYFDLVITADEVEKPKPDPEAFLKCAEAMEKEKPDLIVDSIKEKNMILTYILGKEKPL